MSSEFAIGGVDPGAKGAIAAIFPESCRIMVWDMPSYQRTGTRTFTHVDGVALGRIIRSVEFVHTYVEEVHSMPEQGVASSFAFGDNFGTLKGAFGALEVPLSFVPPSVWKKTLQVPKDKKQAVARAVALFPACASLFTRPDRAEAALIGLYGMLALGHSPKRRFTPIT